jgi:predicted phosphoribosyltransferase
MDSSIQNRREAGRLLAERLSPIVRGEDVLVLGLPKGGVAVAYEIACALGAPLDVLVMRKLEVFGRPYVVVGAIAAGGVRLLDHATIARLQIPHGTIEEVVRREAVELARLERYYREGRQSPRMMGRTIVLVDDGLSDKEYLRAAVDALWAYRPGRVILALPAASAELCAEMRKRSVTVIAARPATGDPRRPFIEDASSVSNRDVRHMLAQSEARFHGQELAG